MKYYGGIVLSTATLFLLVQANTIPQPSSDAGRDVGWNAAPAGWNATAPSGWNATAPSGWSAPPPSGWGSGGSSSPPSDGEQVSQGQIIAVQNFSSVVASTDDTNLNAANPDYYYTSDLGISHVPDAYNYNWMGIENSTSNSGTSTAQLGDMDLETEQYNEGQSEHTLADTQNGTIQTNPEYTSALSAGSVVLSAWAAHSNGTGVNPSGSSGWGSSGWKKGE